MLTLWQAHRGDTPEDEPVIKPDFVSYVKVVDLSAEEIEDKAKNNVTIDDKDIRQSFVFSGTGQVMNMNATIRLATVSAPSLNFV